MRFSILAKSVLTISLLIAISLGMVGVYLEWQERAHLVNQAVARLEAQASLLAAEAPTALAEGDTWAQGVERRAKARVTVIAADGRVLADSEESSSRMENHADRPEVIEALATGSGHSTRFSHTLHRDLVYFAQTVPQASGQRLVLRLAIPLGEVAHGFDEFRRDFLAIAAVSFLCAIGAAFLWARGIARPLREMVAFARGVAKGEMTPRLSMSSHDELGELADALNTMASDLRATLDRLEEESRRIRTIMESMAEGLLVIDARGRITLINPAAEALLGLKRGEALEKTPLEAVRSHELDDLLKAASHQEGEVSAGFTLIHPRRRILAGTAVTVRDTDHTAQWTVLVLRDVTQLKRLEEVRMEFVLNVSHELRTPLTAIRGYAETLLDGGLADQEEARKFLEIIHRHAERLGRLLNDLLDLSNIELERTPLHSRPVVLPDVARQAIAMLAPQAERKTIRLLTAISDEVPPVLADRDRVVQILVNLLDNAVKYTAEGGRVSLSARLLQSASGQEAEPCPAVEVMVEDTGIGIPAKDLPRLTERFYRVDKARSRELGGTGLGLAIVKHLVQAHGGTLSIESEVGRGTIVRFTLPPAVGLSGRPERARSASEVQRNSRDVSREDPKI